MQGGSCHPFVRSGIFSGHKNCCGAVWPARRPLSITHSWVVAFCAVADAKKAAVYFWCNAVREYLAVFWVNHTFRSNFCEAVPDLFATMQCQGVFLTGYGMGCLYRFAITGNVRGKCPAVMEIKFARKASDIF